MQHTAKTTSPRSSFKQAIARAYTFAFCPSASASQSRRPTATSVLRPPSDYHHCLLLYHHHHYTRTPLPGLRVSSSSSRAASARMPRLHRRCACILEHIALVALCQTACPVVAFTVRRRALVLATHALCCFADKPLRINEGHASLLMEAPALERFT